MAYKSRQNSSIYRPILAPWGLYNCENGCD